MRIRGIAALLALLATSACDLVNGNGDGSSMPDQAVGNNSDGSANGDGPGPNPDLVVAPDLTPDNLHLKVDWSLKTANLSGGTNNGFAIACDDPMATVTSLTFYASNAAGTMVTTSAPCPAGAENGATDILLPDKSGGPFTVWARCDGKPNSSSDMVHNVQLVQGEAFVNIYVDGCDQTMCM